MKDWLPWVCVALVVIGIGILSGHDNDGRDELGYRAGEPDEYPPTQGDEWNTEVEDIDEP